MKCPECNSCLKVFRHENLPVYVCTLCRTVYDINKQRYDYKISNIVLINWDERFKRKVL